MEKMAFGQSSSDYIVKIAITIEEINPKYSSSWNTRKIALAICIVLMKQ